MNRMNNKGESKEDRDGRVERKSWRKSRPREDERQKKEEKEERGRKREQESATMLEQSY